MRNFVRECKEKKLTIGFVPTMGAFHEGHLSLIRQARKETDIVIISIFINPLQFSALEDYDTYPRQLEKDIKLAKQENVDCVFAPSVHEMYPKGFLTKIEQDVLPEKLCGAFRPGHFSGVMCVVLKLFNIIQPDIAYFGQKDYQQFVIIKRMVLDLNVNVQLRMLPTVREKSGLAVSSRNVYLKKRERQEATNIYRALKEGEKMIRQGETSAAKVVARMKSIVRQIKGVKIDYVVVANASTLEPVNEIKGKVLLAIAAKIGKARLIDNILVP
jgi:pantoate--beta-alanine ligase